MDHPNFAVSISADRPGDPRRADVRIDRPDKHNAMTVAMWHTLAEICTELATDPELRVVVVSGTGPSFCAGADIGALADNDQAMYTAVAAAESALRDLPVPTIAKIRGNCMGGGTQIAIACDLRLADDSARFAVPPARLSVVYPASSIRGLTALVGPGWAKRLLFTAGTIDARTALRVGLIEELTAPEALDAAVDELVAVLSSRAPLTQAAAKQVVNAVCDGADSAGSADLEAAWQARWAASPDAAEGPRAFLERRPPRFTWHP